MKKNLSITLVFIVLVVIASAQIPNNGFENWTTPVNGLEPTGWYSANSLDPTGDYFPVTRSEDHFPLNTGNYSIRLENKPSLFPGTKAFGLAMTTRLDGSDRPLFAITGHPTSLCGYFKFQSQNNDTMDIHFALYKNGTEVTSGRFINPNSFAEWTSFNIQVDNTLYPEADSARIVISSFYSDNLLVHGNSVLYIDNLSFDVPISAVNDLSPINEHGFIHPNPASDFVVLDLEKPDFKNAVVSFYDFSGQKVKSETLIKNQSEVNIQGLRNGVYLVTFFIEGFSSTGKLVIRR